jgi:hypothetical protein
MLALSSVLHDWFSCIAPPPIAWCTYILGTCSPGADTIQFHSKMHGPYNIKFRCTLLMKFLALPDTNILIVNTELNKN